MNSYDVIVVGGGLVGATFALDLATKSPFLKIGLLESSVLSDFILEQSEIPKASAVSFDSRIYAITPHNITYLEQLGVEGLNDSGRVCAINKMLVYGDNNSQINFNQQLGQQLFLAKILEGEYLLKCIYNQLKDLNTVDFIHDELVDIKKNKTSVEILGKWQSYATKLLVGADGANSFVRQCVGLDANTNSIDYNQSGIVANFSCEISHNNTAFQWFIDDGILAFLPLPNNHISIVWSCNNPQIKLSMSEEDFTNTILSVTNYKLGNLKLISKRFSFPIKLNLIHKMCVDRVVLIGDSAHTIHPLAGQGLNLGFTDARILAHILGSIKDYQIGDVSLLAKYNNLRLPEVRKMQLTCHTLQRLFYSNSGILKYIRNIGLNLVDSLPIIKKQLIKQSCS